MLAKLVILIPSVFSMALCVYLLAGIAIYLRALYKALPATEQAGPRRARRAHISSTASVEIEAIPAV